ncbi:hypothetical protein ZHAS_00008636 [Anopheles sinensis]|uniref:Uncharacterized protein n=1 Tax=Anopheles sinensis TaxID=74873 RepID=A0A084VSS6_ANOSI|nr:hypothetical protein ZHAS_00008636 [Anopheles sinensis]
MSVSEHCTEGKIPSSVSEFNPTLAGATTAPQSLSNSCSLGHVRWFVLVVVKYRLRDGGPLGPLESDASACRKQLTSEGE